MSIFRYHLNRISKTFILKQSLLIHIFMMQLLMTPFKPRAVGGMLLTFNWRFFPRLECLVFPDIGGLISLFRWQNLLKANLMYKLCTLLDFSWASSNFFQFTIYNIPWHYFSHFNYHRSQKNFSWGSSRSGVWFVSTCLHTLNTHMHTGILVFWWNLKVHLHKNSAHYLYSLCTYIHILNIYIWEGEIASCEANEHGLEDKRPAEQEVWEASQKVFFPPLERLKGMWHGIQNNFEIIIEEVKTSLDCPVSDEASLPSKGNNPNRHAW